MAFLSGKLGSVAVNGINYAFGKWELPMHAGVPKVNNFQGGGYEQFVAGLVGAVLTLTGPHDVGGMPVVAGNTYIFTLRWTNAIFLNVTAIVNNIKPTVDVEGADALEVQATVNGAFVAAVI